MSNVEAQQPLRRRDLADDPIEQFDRWFQDAQGRVHLPEAMTLATCAQDGPDARLMLIKSFGPDGFRFFTDLESVKGLQIAADPRAAMVFDWRDLTRQVRIRGRLRQLPDADADRYFSTKTRPQQVSAWASLQSRPVPGRDELDAKVAEMDRRWVDEEEVPRPERWGGFILPPETIEFWQARENPPHDRLLYSRAEEGSWSVERLAP